MKRMILQLILFQKIGARYSRYLDIRKLTSGWQSVILSVNISSPLSSSSSSQKIAARFNWWRRRWSPCITVHKRASGDRVCNCLPAGRQDSAHGTSGSTVETSIVPPSKLRNYPPRLPQLDRKGGMWDVLPTPERLAPQWRRPLSGKSLWHGGMSPALHFRFSCGRRGG